MKTAARPSTREERPAIPVLAGDAKAAVEYRGGHLQIIASAGSGKTEVVSQRVARLLSEGVSPEAIVAFTFTERAAASLKGRIEQRTEALMGREILDRLNGMFVGTIHSYCFRMLQEHVARYEIFDVLDEHRLTAFLTREAYTLGLPSLNGGALYRSIAAFMSDLEIIENELLEPHHLREPLRGIYEHYLATLKESRLLTYGQQIARAVAALDDHATFKSVQGPLRHLIVDEYQDVNPAQEALIAKLAAKPVQLCVVGDDDQAIYQWRGSDVGNIIDFPNRYRGVRQFKIRKNRRSRPGIIDTANGFGRSIRGRLRKRMEHDRGHSGRREAVCWVAETPEEEARTIARAIRSAHDRHGYRYRDIAILCRGRVSFEAIMDALKAEHVPVQPGGRTNLFMQEDADLFGRTMCWLADYDWRVGQYGWTTEKVTLTDLVRRYKARYDLSPSQVRRTRERLKAWWELVHDQKGPANLVGEFYELCGELGIEKWDLTDDWTVNRLGTLARCTQLLADYEAASRRSRPDPARPGEQWGARDRGIKHYQWLARYIQNWAKGAYEDFEGEEDVELDAVDLTTIHQAKGLEWPIVFVPALNVLRFPSSRTGASQNWNVPRKKFDAARYEGSENDERRLFYVAMTRARDQLFLSGFERTQKKRALSPFLLEVAGGAPRKLNRLPAPPKPDRAGTEEELLAVTFSDLASYQNCGLQYRYRTLIGFQPPLAPEIGYGRGVHHVLRVLADSVRATGKTPTTKQVDELFDSNFFLPAANRAAHRELKQQARRLVDRYLADWEGDLHRIWAVERPFELHLDGATLSGRADVILEELPGQPARLSIVDYKTAADAHDQHAFQLQVYTDAGRREGLPVDRAFVHDLRDAQRESVPVDDAAIVDANDRVERLVTGLRAREFRPNPGVACRRCDIKPICPYRR